MKTSIISSVAPLAILAGLTGCTTMEKPSVIAATGTTIGLSASQEAGAGSPSVTFGYKRAEVALVSDQKLKSSANQEDIANVVMELNYANSGTNAGVYQRLAVGRDAVRGAGAALMFAKDRAGTISAEAQKAVDDAVDGAAAAAGQGFD